jgi:L-amino acid N-acyltransferase YncA
MEDLRAMSESDWTEVERIYVDGIATKNATFETSSPGWDKWDRGHLKQPRLIYEIDGKIAGWAALSPVSSRKVYEGVAEVSVYIDQSFRGRGVATKLLDRLIQESENAGIWTLQASIFPENEASLKLHYKFGFRTLGFREKIAQMDGIWRDTIILERRSKMVGI